MAQKMVSQRTLALWLGVTPRAIANYTNEGMPCVRGAKTVSYPWPECRRWRDDQLQKSARERAEKAQPVDFQAAKARLAAAQADKAELELDELRGNLVRLDVHEARVARLCDRLAAVCKGGLGKYIADVQRATTQVDAQSLMERIGDDLLRALSTQTEDVDTTNEEEVA